MLAAIESPTLVGVQDQRVPVQGRAGCGLPRAAAPCPPAPASRGVGGRVHSEPGPGGVAWLRRATVRLKPPCRRAVGSGPVLTRAVAPLVATGGPPLGEAVGRTVGRGVDGSVPGGPAAVTPMAAGGLVVLAAVPEARALASGPLSLAGRRLGTLARVPIRREPPPAPGIAGVPAASPHAAGCGKGASSRRPGEADDLGSGSLEDGPPAVGRALGLPSAAEGPSATGWWAA